MSDKQDFTKTTYKPAYGEEAPKGGTDASNDGPKLPPKAPPIPGFPSNFPSAEDFKEVQVSGFVEATFPPHPSHRMDDNWCQLCSQPTSMELITKPCLAVPHMKETKAEAGRKYDTNKLMWSLLPTSALKPVIKVLMKGAEKYAPFDWKKVPNAKERYYNAAMRHLTDWYEGEANDPEWGYSHLAHAACCIIFLIWLEENDAPKKG